MSNSKIQIQLKACNQISNAQSIVKIDESKIKVSLKKKSPLDHTGLIDLKLYYQSSQKPQTKVSNKSLIINILSQLIEHTEEKIKMATGEERKKQQFRSTQFRKAVTSLQSHPFEITCGNDAKQLDGIGKGIADRIDEILKTGTLSELGQVITSDSKTTIIKDLTSVTGIGESHAKKFMEMGVTSVDDLINKVNANQIKVTHHIDVGLKYYFDFQKKIPYDEIAELGAEMKLAIMKSYPDLIVEICGSHRRKKLLSGDIDVLITHSKIISDDDLIKSNVHHLKNIVKLLKEIEFVVSDLTSQGDTKYMGVCRHKTTKIGRRIDIRFVPYESFYPALLYFTGSMMTNKLMRTIALTNGYTLNEYGLYRFVNGQKGEKVIVNSEKEIFNVLGIKYLEPTEREIN